MLGMCVEVSGQPETIVLSFHCVGLTQTQIFKLGVKHLNSLSHLIGPSTWV